MHCLPDRAAESLIRTLRTRHGRKKSDACLCEGLRACRELIAKVPDLILFGVLRKDIEPISGTESFFRAEDSWFSEFAPTVQSQGILIVAKRPTPPREDEKVKDAFIVALDQVTDPGNLGTIMRTAAASGRKEIWLTKGSADPFNEKVIRAAIAIQFSMKIRFFDSLEEMVRLAPSLGIDGPVYLTSPHEGESVFEAQALFDRSLLVFGGEANGISSVPTGSQWVTLPMPGGEESLNVAQAATVFLFEYVRRCQIQG